MDSKETKSSISIENLSIPSIDSILYGNINELIFVNHSKTFTNCFNRTFTLDETPIKIYKNTGDPVKKTNL